MDKVHLSKLACHETILRDHARLQILQSRQTSTRLSQLTTFLYQSVSIVSLRLNDAASYRSNQSYIAGVMFCKLF